MKQLLLFFLISFLSSQSHAQRGKDGSYTVNSLNSLVNSYTVLNANASAGQTLITVASNALVGGFFQGVLTPGDLIMIIQMQGATLNVDTYPASEYVSSNGQFWGPYTTPQGHINDWNQNIPLWGEIVNYNNSGKFELAEVKSVSGGNTISLMCPLINNYSISGHVQVVRIPRFINLTLNANSSIVPSLWNGNTGGVVAVEVDNNLNINSSAKISASGYGFRGGVTEDQTLGSPPGNVNDIGFCASHVATQGAEKGESIAGFYTEYDFIYSRYCKGAPANGGGGGNNHNAGGGGGSNVGNVAQTYTGKGIPDPTYNVNWNLEIAGMGGSVSPGGGRGGYSGATVNQNENIVGPNSTAWGGDYRRKEGGLGGHPLTQDNTRLFAGGGGGAGDQNNSQGGNGGRGGGIAYIQAYGNISGNGTIEANGANGVNANPNGQTAIQASTQKYGNDGAGGAGGGGSIYISNATSIPNTISIQANGGNGGNQVISFGVFASSPTMEADGPGGGGGGGYINISLGSPTMQVNGGVSGVTNSAFVPNFPPNGATGGASGIFTTNTSFYDILAANDTLCGPGSVTLSASTIGNPPAGALTWYTTPFGNTVVGTGNNFTTPVLNSTTTYYISLCPGTFRKPVSVVVGAPPLINGIPNITNATCLVPGSINGLSVSGGAQPYSYSWSNNGGNSINLTNASAGTYTLTVFDAAGCSSTSSPLTILGSNGPSINTANAVINPQSCDGSLGSISGITATGNNLTYSWSNNGGAAINPSGLVSGTYTLTVTDGNGCIAMSNALTVPFLNGPTIDSSQINYVLENCGQQDGGISGITVSGNGLNYQWIPGNINSANLNNVAAGQYTLIVTDQNNCTDTLGPLTIQAATPLLIDTTLMQVLDELCGQNNGGISGINVTGGTAPLTYLWSNQQNTLNLPVGLSAGTYSLVVYDDAGCIDSITGVIVNSIGGPLIDTSLLQITPVGCNGEPGSIEGISSAVGNQFSWSNSINTADNIGVGTGAYTLTVSDANNCISSINFFVPALTPVNLDETALMIVNPTCLVDGSISGITASGGTNSYTYTWQPGNINSLNLQNLNAGSYILFVTDANGCSDTSALYTLSPPNYPIASFAYSPTIPNVGDTITFSNTSTNYTTEQWVNAGISVNQPSPWNYSYTAGTFLVTLIVTNSEGCVDTTSVFITVYDQIQVPNVFSPNGDQINDELYIQSLKPNTTITILNRWGNIVYFSENYLNNWDGTDQNGMELTEGVYTIILTDLLQNNTYYFVHLFR